MVEMKDTGKPWIGEIPIQWDCDRVGRTTYVKGRIGWNGLRTDDFIEEGPYLITGTDFQNGSINWSECFHVDEDRYEEDPFIILQEDDVLITKDGTIGKVAHIEKLRGKSTLNSGIFVTRPIKGRYFQRYFYWVISSSIFKEFVEFNSSGSTIVHLYQNVFERFYFPIPSLSEQKQISLYLDKKTQKIDTLIAKIQKKIDLIQQQKNAVINKCVNKGFSEKVEMKDSGVEWIGQIPKHWGVKKLKKVSTISTGTTPPTSNKEYYSDGSVLWIKPGDLQEFTPINNSDQKLTSLGVSQSRLLESKSILVCGIGTIGKFGYSLNEVTTNQQINGITFNEKIINREFGLFLVSSMEEEFVRSSEKVVVPILSKGRMEELYVPVPPIDEQIVLSSYLNKKISLLLKQSELEKKRINVLLKYRQAFISSAVTGKIKISEEML